MSRRPATAAERALARAQTSITPDDLAWCALPMLALCGAGWLVQVLVRWAGANVAPWPVVVGAALGAPLSAFVASRLRRARALDSVEVLNVTAARFVEIEETNDEGPHYFIQVDAAKLLFLSGQWLFDPAIVGAARGSEFPTADFELVRDAATGRVLALRPAGAVIALVRTLRIRDLPFSPDFPYADAVLLEGTLEDLPRAVADAARTRT